MELYDRIGKEYDASRKADPHITERLLNHLQVFDRSPILDAACGTGNYTVALSQKGFAMTGVDVSEEMLNQARTKSAEVTWDKADVTHLPYPDGTFWGATCILAIHHVAHLQKAFREIYRVMNRGRFVIFTSSPEQMRRYWLNEYFPAAMMKSCGQMPPVPQVVECLKEAGFYMVGIETFLVQPNLRDFFLYSGKYEPGIYLNPKVRAGISTFANLAADEEIREGCARLQSDIASGKIAEVMERYSSDLGDYLFVVAGKK